jgi:hypothetical protein
METRAQSHQWIQRGDELMAIGTLGHFEQAAKCYRRGATPPTSIVSPAQRVHSAILCYVC